MRKLPVVVSAAAGLSLWAFAGAALAQDAAGAAAAEQLFQEGRVLIQRDRWAEACPKLAESLRLDPAVGASLNLAECYERIDKIASAWATYRKAETMARRAGQRERFTHAAARAATLEGELSRLTIKVKAPADGMVVTRDGEAIGSAAWGMDVPMDGGLHVIEASAPGRRPWRREVHLAARAGSAAVEIPELERESSASPLGVSPSGGASKTQRTIGWIGLATGAAAAGTGLVFGAVARSTYAGAADHCSTVDCDERGVALTREARSEAMMSTVLLAAGGALAVAGVVLVVTAPSRTTPQAGMVLSPSASGVWVTF